MISMTSKAIKQVKIIMAEDQKEGISISEFMERYV